MDDGRRFVYEDDDAIVIVNGLMVMESSVYIVGSDLWRWSLKDEDEGWDMLHD